MDVNSISGEVIALKIQPVKPTVSLDPPVKGTTTNNQASNRMVASSAVDATTSNMGVPVDKHTPAEGIEGMNEPVKTMSHVVVVYNRHGDVRIKFMDSKNNVTYQIPSEMVARIEDQMVNVGTTSTIKA